MRNVSKFMLNSMLTGLNHECIATFVATPYELKSQAIFILLYAMYKYTFQVCKC